MYVYVYLDLVVNLVVVVVVFMYLVQAHDYDYVYDHDHDHVHAGFDGSPGQAGDVLILEQLLVGAALGDHQHGPAHLLGGDHVLGKQRA